jgi:hypothetical protein
MFSTRWVIAGRVFVLLGLFIFLSAPLNPQPKTKSLDFVTIFPGVKEQLIEAGSTLTIMCTKDDKKIVPTLRILPFLSIPQLTENKTVCISLRKALSAVHSCVFFHKYFRPQTNA